MLSLGPDTSTVLSLNIISNAIWEVKDRHVLMIRDHYHMHAWTLVDRVRPYIVTMRLHGVSPLGTKKINYTLLSASIKHWL